VHFYPDPAQARASGLEATGLEAVGACLNEAFLPQHLKLLELISYFDLHNVAKDSSAWRKHPNLVQARAADLPSLSLEDWRYQ